MAIYKKLLAEDENIRVSGLQVGPYTYPVAGGVEGNAIVLGPNNTLVFGPGGVRYVSHTFTVQPGSVLNQNYVFVINNALYDALSNTAGITVRVTYSEEVVPGEGFQSGIQRSCYLNYIDDQEVETEVQIPESPFPLYKEFQYVIPLLTTTYPYPNQYTFTPVAEPATSDWCPLAIAGDSFTAFTEGIIPGAPGFVSLSAAEMIRLDYGWYRVESPSFPQGTYYIVWVVLDRPSGGSFINQVSAACTIGGPQQ